MDCLLIVINFSLIRCILQVNFFNHVVLINEVSIVPIVFVKVHCRYYCKEIVEVSNFLLMIVIVVLIEIIDSIINITMEKSNYLVDALVVVRFFFVVPNVVVNEVNDFYFL